MGGIKELDDYIYMVSKVEIELEDNVNVEGVVKFEMVDKGVFLNDAKGYEDDNDK
ncbi:hypothetical protein [Staphylococcus warneri]|uniref:hypothetical protein n=1 Tax=Staphylococcus warneri TaxID=1292 RepID=UPI001643751A|nr:hypothetical protein [Staphylococcus warneri]